MSAREKPVSLASTRSASATLPAPRSDPKSIVGSVRANGQTLTKQPSPAHGRSDAPLGNDGLLATIRTLGGILDDLERVRIMATNRVAAQEREYGSAVPHLDLILTPIRVAEHEAELELIRAWRKHRLASWAKGIKGVGEK